MAIYKGILRPAEDGVFGVEVLGLAVNGEGETVAAAVDDAAVGISEVTSALAARGEAIPGPVEPTAADLERGTLVVFHAAPAVAA